LAPVESGPPVSVIVRTKDRPHWLAEALRSLDASSYRRTEIVLVNDGGAPPQVAPLSLPVVRVDLATNRGRAAAANAGVEAASGVVVPRR
jgi:glycosyltransferase involved in cell wall biosynthesis